MTDAPVCPISRSQTKPNTPPALQPAIPLATDLASLIAAINAMIDIVRGLTTSLTVNNTWLQGPPIPQNNYLTSPYPSWQEVFVQNDPYFCFHLNQSDPTHKDDRVWRSIVSLVEYNNANLDNDIPFFWRRPYSLPVYVGGAPSLQSLSATGGLPPFQEDFFERIVNVQWSAALAVEFFDGDGFNF